LATLRCVHGVFSYYRLVISFLNNDRLIMEVTVAVLVFPPFVRVIGVKRGGVQSGTRRPQAAHPAGRHDRP